MTGVALKRVDSLTHDDWRHDRRSGIGGSDAAAVMGVNKYRDSFCTYVDKVCEELPSEEGRPDYLIESAYWGTALEPVVAQEFAKQTGLHLIKPAYLYTSAVYPFMRATLDYLVADPKQWPFSEPALATEMGLVHSADYIEQCFRTAGSWAGEYPGELALSLGPLDIKTCSAYSKKDWETGPSAYCFAQLQHYMLALGKEQAWAACLIGGQRFVKYRVEFDPEYSDRLLEAERDLWARVLTGSPPEADQKCSDVAEATERLLRNTGVLRSIHPATKSLPGWN